jgi:hypothetical protein
MKEQPLNLVPSVRVVMATDPDLAQLAAWRRLWELLLTNKPTNSHASKTER